jgi:hypothetical protein
MKYDNEFAAWYSDFKLGANKAGVALPSFEEMQKEYPAIAEAYRMSFQNSMMQIEDKIQQDVVSELKTVLKLVPKVADPENINTKKIVQTLQDLIDEADGEVDYVDDISELGVSDEDLED